MKMENRFGSGSRAFIFFLLLLGAGALSVVLPLLQPIIWAAVIAFLVHPVYQSMLRRLKGRFQNAAAAATLICVFVLVLLPVVWLLGQLAVEAAHTYESLSAFLKNFEKPQPEAISSLFPSSVAGWIESSLKDGELLRKAFDQLMQRSATMLARFSRAFLQATAGFVFESLIVLVVTFFFVRDGKKIVDYLYQSTPLQKADRDTFFKQMEGLLRAIVFGVLLTVAIQAVLGGIGWWFVGLPSPLFFASLMFLCGMLPMMGTALVWLPGGLYLLLAGHVTQGIGLLLWGVLVVGSVDNFLRPLFISGGSRVPTLTIFIGILGGIIAWGFLGIFLGPLVIALFMLVFETYRKQQLCVENDEEPICKK